MSEHKKWENEWYIISSVFITCALMFIVIHSSKGTAQVLGAAMSPVVGGALIVSKNWKNQDSKVHYATIILSIFSVLIFSAFFRKQNK